MLRRLAIAVALNGPAVQHCPAKQTRTSRISSRIYHYGRKGSLWCRYGHKRRGTGGPFQHSPLNRRICLTPEMEQHASTDLLRPRQNSLPSAKTRQRQRQQLVGYGAARVFVVHWLVDCHPDIIARYAWVGFFLARSSCSEVS